MKPRTLKTLAILLILGGSLSVCKEEEKKCNCSNEQAFTASNLKGVVNFNEDIRKWYISVHEEGTYDEVKLFFPCHLEESYKAASKDVLFSGVASNTPLNIATPAGTYCFCIEITSIATIN